MSKPWEKIEGTSGLYEVSKRGQIRSLITKNIKLLNPSTTPSGYKAVAIKVDGKRKTFLVHRLVAKAFIPNPYEKRTVNDLENKGRFLSCINY